MASQRRDTQRLRWALLLAAAALASQTASAATIAPAPTETVVSLYIGAGPLGPAAAGSTQYGYTKPIPIYASVVGVDAATVTPRMTTYMLGCAAADTPQVTDAPNAVCLGLKEGGWTFAQAPGTFREWGTTQIYESMPPGVSAYYAVNDNCEVMIPTATAAVTASPTGKCTATITLIAVSDDPATPGAKATTNLQTQAATQVVTDMPSWVLPVTVTGGLDKLAAAAVTDAAATGGTKPTPGLQNAAGRAMAGGSEVGKMTVALAGVVAALVGGWLA